MLLYVVDVDARVYISKELKIYTYVADEPPFSVVVCGTTTLHMQVAPRPNTFLPFGNGVHACPGNELAKLEMLVLIHHLVTAYRCVHLLPDPPYISACTYLVDQDDTWLGATPSPTSPCMLQISSCICICICICICMYACIDRSYILLYHKLCSYFYINIVISTDHSYI
jgi:hypothetical protein